MSKSTILSTGPVDQIVVDTLAPFAQVSIAPKGTEEVLVPLIEHAIGLIVRGDGVASERVIKAGKQLQVIGRTGVGYNNIDIGAATRRKLPVVYTPGAGSRAVAEAAMAMMLALVKRLQFWDRQLKGDNWRSRFESNPGDMDGTTLGIIGFGRIGQTLAQMAQPFNMNIVAHDPYVPDATARSIGVKLVDLRELISSADFISIHAAATAENRHLIDGDLLKSVKRGSILINLARGELIESLDILHEAMVDGRLAAVGLDVFSPEPPDVSHPIFKMDNCLTAPHALGQSKKAMERVFTSMANDMAAVFSGRKPKLVVNPEVLGG